MTNASGSATGKDKATSRRAFVWTAIALLSVPTLAQNVLRLSDPHEFEVVSIKPGDPSETGFLMNITAAGTDIVNRPVSALILQAYGLVSNSQAEGLPSWATEKRFDIKAQPDEAYRLELAKLDPLLRWTRLAQMNQRLLQDRFGFRAHIEVRHRKQLQLIRADPDKTPERLKPSNDGSVPVLSAVPGRYTAHALDLDTLCEALSKIPELDQPLVNATGIKGRFDFQLRWTPADRRVADDGPDADPPLSKALQEQLGLTLVRRVGDSEVLVVDHLSYPEVN